jgi:tetratricopeptide (TPR) repeat protein
MKNLKFILLAAVSILLSACSSQDQQTSEDLGQSDEMVTEPDILPMVPDGAQAMSLLGKPLYPAEPSPALLDNLAEAKANYDADPDDAMNIIWYGRRVAYTGDYRRAIEIFTEGIEKHPEDARMYRHRGHRYISIREIDRAVADYEMAEKLIQGTEDKIEPDGAPNPQGIFLTSTHSNIYYHLGLSYYLRQDWEKALAAFKASYHNLTLMYKGEIPPEELVNIDPNDPSGAAIAYGVANWFLYNGDEERACDLMERFMNTSSWSAFGFIAAEVDLSLR